MFFDDNRVDTAYQELLLAIAKKQQELLYERFDWKNRVRRVWPPRGLFGKDKKAIAHHQALLAELEQLKADALAHRKKQGYAPGTFWWNLPWEQVELYLFCDLEQIDETGPWRFARRWEMVHDGDRHTLVLLEEGHCSLFDGKYSRRYEEISQYSADERRQMARDYNKRINDYELTQLMLCNDAPVRSFYGQEFDTMADYLLSSDHYCFRDFLDSRYRRSLYTEHHTNAVTVHSRSIHYKCILGVGGIHLRRDGLPDRVTIMNYEPVNQDGPIPEGISEEYFQKDAAVALAAYMADHSEFSAVPVQLFGRNMIESAASYNEAMRQAQLYTCLAHKLKFIDQKG